MEERREVRRYKLALQLEIKPESKLKEFEPIWGRTRDVSTQGFYFGIGQLLAVGMKFGFSIMPPWETTQAAQAFISGRARVVRVEELPETCADRVGIAAAIEEYTFGLAESSAS